jgi:hypothetical protein
MEHQTTKQHEYHWKATMGHLSMEALFQQAAEAGHLSICQWIYELTKDWTTFFGLPYKSGLCVKNALIHGQLHILDWARDQIGLDRPDYNRSAVRQGQNILAV